MQANPLEPANPSDLEVLQAAPTQGPRRNPWVVCVLPLAVFMLVGSLEPKPPAEEVAAEPATQWQFPYDVYPLIYTLKIIATTAALVLVWPGIRELRSKVSPLAVLVGVAGVFIWVGLWKLDLERGILAHFGADQLLGLGQRSAFNPFENLAEQPALAYGFVVVRLFGLVCVIALAEELFLRGFLMRFVMRSDWWNVPFGQATPLALVVGTVVPMLMHPAEILAAAVWFSLVSWLMVRTRSFWNCVVAHGTTNLLMGLYVLWSGGEAWQLL